MKAVSIRKFGGPEVLEWGELPTPQAQSGSVLIRVERAGVNFADLSRRDGSYGSRQLPQVMGVEVAGICEDSGERVVALLPSGGGYAEYALAPAHLVFSIPTGINSDQAVALFEQGITAYDIVHTVGRLQQGESVVVHAAAGGVGSIAVQLAKLQGAARVIAVASTPQKRALALELGADVAIEAEATGLAQRILEANGGRQVNIVLEMVGGQVFEQSLEAVAPFGRLVVYGQASDVPNQISTDPLMSGSKGVLGYWLWHTLERRTMAQSALDALFALAQSGHLRPIIGSTMPLSQAAEAHRLLASRQTTGKLLLDPSL